MEAAAIGEHLIQLKPADIALHRDMVQLYISLGMAVKMRSQLHAFIDLLAHKQQWYEIKNISEDCGRFADDGQRSYIYSDLIIYADKVGCPSDIVISSIEQVTDDLSKMSNKKCLQTFMASLQAHSDKLYNHALAYISHSHNK